VAERDATRIGALDDPSGVGARVAALRRERGLSLSELARRAGVGKATLSGLEAGTRNPTLDTLQAVAAALAVPITAVVAGSGPLRGTAVEVDVVRTFDDGDVTYELCVLRIPAGAAQTSPAHSAGVTEHATVFAGVLEAGVVGAPGRAAAGESVEWPADVPHGYAAVGDADVAASLVIRTPRP
jgi:XRE family transcriptional regulator, regulator of sulfur utilization